MSNGGGEGIANFRNVEKLKIWLALADDYEGEPATAQAAMGALATAAADEGEARILIISRTQTQVDIVFSPMDSTPVARGCSAGIIGVSEALTADEVDGIERIKSILSSGVVNMVYRAAVAVGMLM